MKILEVKERAPDLIKRLTEVWEDSVRATHLFLSDPEIRRIREYVPRALKQVARLIMAENAEEKPVAFMGIEGHKLEMLFVASAERGKGLGTELLRYGLENCSVRELTVNEQNPSARVFYESMGFRVCKRTECDEQGDPYPLLCMRWSENPDV